MLIMGDRKFGAQAQEPSARMQAGTADFDRYRKEFALSLNPVELSNNGRMQKPGVGDAGSSMEDHGVVLDQKAENTWLVEKSGVDFGEKFLKLSEMTIAERLRFFFLEDREMTEEDLKAMSEKDRQAIEDQIRQMIMAALGWDDDEYDAAFGKYLSPQGEAGSTAQAGGGETPDNLGEIDTDPMLALLAGAQVSAERDDKRS